MTWEVARSARGRYASSSRPPGWLSPGWSPAGSSLAELGSGRLTPSELAPSELAAAEGPAQLRREAQPPLRVGMRQRREDLQAAAA